MTCVPSTCKTHCQVSARPCTSGMLCGCLRDLSGGDASVCTCLMRTYKLPAYGQQGAAQTCTGTAGCQMRRDDRQETQQPPSLRIKYCLSRRIRSPSPRPSSTPASSAYLLRHCQRMPVRVWKPKSFATYPASHPGVCTATQRKQCVACPRAKGPSCPGAQQYAQLTCTHCRWSPPATVFCDVPQMVVMRRCT